jgi:hypothetical protein
MDYVHNQLYGMSMLLLQRYHMVAYQLDHTYLHFLD